MPSRQGVSTRQVIPSAMEVDRVFPIPQGTLNLITLENQTLADNYQFSGHWMLNHTDPDEHLICICTDTDPLSIFLHYQQRFPALFKNIQKVSQLKHFHWFDMFTYANFPEPESQLVAYDYETPLRQLQIPLDLHTIRKPYDYDSADGLPYRLRALFQEILQEQEAKHDTPKMRIFMGLLDDLSDLYGPRRLIHLFRYILNLCAKFMATGIASMFQESQDEMQRTMSRLAHQIIHFGFSEDPVTMKPSRYIQVKKTAFSVPNLALKRYPYELEGDTLKILP